MPVKVSTGRVRQVYRFIEAHRNQFSIEAMCKILEVAPSGYYEWLMDRPAYPWATTLRMNVRDVALRSRSSHRPIRCQFYLTGLECRHGRGGAQRTRTVSGGVPSFISLRN